MPIRSSCEIQSWQGTLHCWQIIKIHKIRISLWTWRALWSLYNVIETVPVSQEKVILFRMKLKESMYSWNWRTQFYKDGQKPERIWTVKLFHTGTWDEISIEDCLLLKGNRIITPEQLRPRCWKFWKTVTWDKKSVFRELNPHWFGQE